MVSVRRATPDDIFPFFEAMSLQFSFDLPEGQEQRDAWRKRILDVGGMDRGFVAEDGDRIVGTLGCFDLDMTVPDGSIPCAGTTRVTVAPTHRRQGVLRSLMEAHLTEAVEHGDVIAALWASDSAIYGRFGFGVAVESFAIDLDRTRARLGKATPTPERIEPISADEAATALPPLFERIRREIPGSFARTDSWWTHRRLRDPEDRRNGASALRTALSVGDDGRATGYVQFRVESRFDGAHSDDVAHVVELFGSTPGSWSGLWSLVLGLDLATTIRSRYRPIDDPLFEFLEGIRRVNRTLIDTEWVRVLDVERALTSRTYAEPGAVTLAITDGMGIANGTFRLGWDGSHIDCGGSTGAADLEIDVSDLGVALMGRPRFSAGVLAGTIRGSTESAAMADRMFVHHRAPYCQEQF